MPDRKPKHTEASLHTEKRRDERVHTIFRGCANVRALLSQAAANSHPFYAISYIHMYLRTILHTQPFEYWSGTVNTSQPGTPKQILKDC